MPVSHAKFVLSRCTDCGAKNLIFGLWVLRGLWVNRIQAVCRYPAILPLINIQTPYFSTYSWRALFDLPKLCMVVELVVLIVNCVNQFSVQFIVFQLGGKMLIFGYWVTTQKASQNVMQKHHLEGRILSRVCPLRAWSTNKSNTFNFIPVWGFISVWWLLNHLNNNYTKCAQKYTTLGRLFLFLENFRHKFANLVSPPTNGTTFSAL